MEFTDREIVMVEDYTLFLRSVTLTYHVLHFLNGYATLLWMYIAKILAHLAGRKSSQVIFLTP